VDFSREFSIFATQMSYGLCVAFLCLSKAVFAEIVAFRTDTIFCILYGFRALFLIQKEFALKKLVVNNYLIATKVTKRALSKG
jgi:hypothetical protein